MLLPTGTIPEESALAFDFNVALCGIHAEWLANKETKDNKSTVGQTTNRQQADQVIQRASDGLYDIEEERKKRAK